jgi:hypothetical protein
MHSHCAVACLLLSIAVAAGGEARNVARGRPYTMTRPSYHLCSDPGDRTQLTDGVYTEGYFWTQSTTVGWGRGTPAFITIDLGGPHAIGGASFSTAAGVAGVLWPAALLVFVSDNGKQWFPAGDLVELSETGAPPPIGRFATHTFRTQKLRTRGRYVQFACLPTGPYLFVDEIEVYGGDAALLAQPREGEPVGSVPALMDTLQLNRLLKAQLRRDLAAARFDLETLPEEEASPLPGRAAALERRIAAIPLVSPEGFRAVLPMTDLEREIFRFQAAVWRAQKKPKLRVWKTHRWDPLAPSDEPPADAPAAALRVDVLRGEWRADTLNLTNAGDADLRLRVSVEGLPGDDTVTVHEVLHVGTRHSVAVAAALPRARREGGAWMVSVPSGMTRQVWFSVHPTDAAPGAHDGRVLLRGDDGLSVTVPFRLRVRALRFPAKTTLQLGGWSYTNAARQYGLTPQNRDALVAILREHHVNAPWATRAALPSGRYDAAGNLTEKPDTSNLDAWLTLWPGAERYHVFLALGSYNSVDGSFDGAEVGTPLFAKKVGNWIRFWADHLRARGLKASQLALLLVDEPNRKEQFDVTTAWTKAVHAAEPDVAIWVDAVPRELDTCREMMQAVDVLVPNRSQWLQKDERYRRLFLDQRGRGCKLGFYSCAGPARRFDPYSYYLLQQWHVFAIGGEWAGFWAFADSGGTSCWNEYVAKGNGPYCPLYIDKTSVTTAKYLEAIREGVQDYECLVMLRDRIAALERAGRAVPMLHEAKALLDGAGDRVLAAEHATAYGWDVPKDRGLADQVRIEVLDMIAALDGS